MRLPAGHSCIATKMETSGERKRLSMKALNTKIRKDFGKVSDGRNAKKIEIPMSDALMSGFAMFSLKLPSLLSFDSTRASQPKSENLKNLFGIEKIPSDTGMREILDPVEPKDLQPAFKHVFGELQRGKALEQYSFLDQKHLVAIDGTGYFSSDTVHCNSCLEKHSKKSGTTTYQHQMLAAVLIHPDQKQVIPLCPEAIVKQDGSTKNDCERNACGRILEQIRKDHPRLNIIITEDGLASNAPHIADLEKFGMSYILGAKPGDHKHLFEEFSLAGEREQELLIRDDDGTLHIFRFTNDLPLNASNEDVRVNFLDYQECRPNGKVIHFSWVTDIELNNTNVEEIMRGGRARWKIENETFNTLKDQGYEFEHNYGHGHKNLSVVLAHLMMLAFLVDQAQLLTSKVLGLALKNEKRLSNIYAKIRHFFETFSFLSWEELYSALAYGINSVFEIGRRSNNTS